MSASDFEASRVLSALAPSTRGLCADSRAVGPGVAFAAFPGGRWDGRDFIAEALAAGASGVLWEPENFEWRPEWEAPNVAVPNLRGRLGALADFVYGSPSAEMPVVAVTGANGKTTICHFAAQLLSASGIRAGVLGTAGNGFPPDDLRPAAMTTPDAAELHRRLRELRDDGAEAAALEASSHGLSQGRLNGARIRAGVFSNLGRDHLDYHGGRTDYFRAKARLFDAPGMRLAVVNADDECGGILIRELRDKMPVVSFGERKGARRVSDFAAEAGGAKFRITDSETGGADSVLLSAPGRHNALNFVAALLAAEAAGADWESSLRAAAGLALPEGRMSRVNPGRGPAVYVDYAHAPEALSAALSAAREGGADSLWAVFGCGGNRDIGKRRLMGEAARAADWVVITDDNPRDENPEEIAAPVLKAAGARGVRIADRRAAIFHAVSNAKEGDAIVVAGKGHEREQEFENGRRVPFCDLEVAREALAMRVGRGEDARDENARGGLR